MGIQNLQKQAVYTRSARVVKYHKMSLSSLNRCMNGMENCWEAAGKKAIAKQSGNKCEMEKAEQKMHAANKEFSEASNMFIKAVENKEFGDERKYYGVLSKQHAQATIIFVVFAV